MFGDSATDITILFIILAAGIGAFIRKEAEADGLGGNFL